LFENLNQINHQNKLTFLNPYIHGILSTFQGIAGGLISPPPPKKKKNNILENLLEYIQSHGILDMNAWFK
jgi:hypothetical protein